MGKNKWYDEIDNGVSPNFRSTAGNGTSRQKKSSSLPSLFLIQKQDEPSFAGFFQSKLKLLKRKWLSLKFRSTQVSDAAFNKYTLMKFGFLAIAAFYLLGGKTTAAGFIGGSQKIEWAREENLAIGVEKKRPVKPKEKKLPTIKNVRKMPKTETEPVSREMLRSDQSSAYIRKYSGIARQEMHKFGIPASISLAQGLVESRAGTSKLAVGNNNHFGMKCFSKNCRKGHCSNHTDDTHKDFFLKFSSPEQSWRAHSQLLMGARYAKLKNYGRDYRRWAQGLKNAGYATDKTYDKKLIGIIERYDLHQYDK